MSTAANKRSLLDAAADAEALKAILPASTYRQWVVAGSIRRRCEEIGDVEHVIEPVFADVPSPNSLFGEPQRVNLFMAQLDAILESGVIQRHVYGYLQPDNKPIYRWGNLYRGVDFRGFTHEFFCGTPGNFGATLAIRTGSADFSKRLVTGLLRNGRRNHDGKVWKCSPCAIAGYSGERCGPLCALCQGTGLEPTVPLSVPTEREYFELCGEPWREPEDR